MSRSVQPCDWYEHDVQGKYVVEVFGRTDDGNVACVRINGFKPYFYAKNMPPSSKIYDDINKKWECKFGERKGEEDYAFNLSKRVPEYKGVTSTKVKKYDVFGGFSDLEQIDVWKVECGSLAAYRSAKTHCTGQQYESNLPPFLRLFHDRHLGPASPFRMKKFQEVESPTNEDGDQLYFVDTFYECNVQDIEASDDSIPMMVASYDLEMYSKSGMFPQSDKDPIIQIGVSYRWSHKMMEPAGRVVFVLDSVEKSDDPTVEFISCRTEKELIQKFQEEIQTENPDILCGYNIFGFDDAYIEGRCQALGLAFDLSRKKAERNEKNFETKKFELASGKYDLRFMVLRGRLSIDLLLNMRREHSLSSFKLDSVASVFLRDKALNYERIGSRICVQSKSTRGLMLGNYVRFDIVGNTTDPYRDGEKYKVIGIDSKSFTIDATDDLFSDLTENERKSLEWTFSKDDVEPHELFKLHAQGGPVGRSRIAKYCIQDCDLVLTLMAKLDTIVNARGMADVCKVPMDFVLQRGQGIKIFSAVVYYASQRNQIIQVQPAMEGEGGYEGAIVISPKIGMYLDQPISVLDFNSLYPTNMIAYNLSPDTLVCERVVDPEGYLMSPSKDEYEAIKKRIADWKTKGYVFEEIEFDNKDDKDNVVSKTICTYVQPTSDSMTVGVLPKTLDILLKKRKEFKEKMEDKQYDESQRSVFNGLQLAYKVVANSVYGQCGSRTSPIRKLCVAASTTAAGRKALYLAKRVVETEYGAEVVYGDTDSIFIKFPTTDLAESIRLGISAGKRITEQCRRPYKIAYEKTFYPFILFCRKRYVGMMFEEDPNIKPKRKEMGIVLKRRDNAPIVKDVFGGALDILMKERNVKKAQAYVSDMLVKILENKIPLEKFIVSKSLRDDYKNPDQIAHRVLADRMETRDPGTAPKVGDRVQYVYVSENSSKSKQGDRIEDVDHVRKNKLTPDAKFYVTNQVQNPVAQLFALCIEDLDGFIPPKSPTYKQLYEKYLDKFEGDRKEEEATLRVLADKEKQLDSILFLNSPLLAKIIRKNTRGPMDTWLKR